MTKLFEEAVAKVKKLPDEDQDIAAELLLTLTNAEATTWHLSSEQVEEVKRIQEDLREGRTALITDEEMEAFWKKCGL